MEEEKKEHEVVLGTLYDMNKTLVKNAEIILPESVLNSKKEIVKNFVNKTNNYYYMLLCNERKDYTIFHIDNLCNDKKPMELSLCLIDECLKNRGEIRGIDLTKAQDAIEIWMVIEDEAYVYYFFPYDAAIIEM